MGDYNVSAIQNRQELQAFMQLLLKDTQALEHMLQEDWFETTPIRIGAEQEMCLVDRYWRPMHVNLQALKNIGSDQFTSELANFNLEANLLPLPFSGSSLSEMHKALKQTLNDAQEKIHLLNSRILLTGILPTIRKADVEIENITPIARYRALMDALRDLRGELFELRIRGIDELNVKQETAMLEACNTSFQVHLQVTPQSFVSRYNIAQALAGPTMAISTNSPMLFGKRLWRETRIALFQQSIDVRTFTEHFRERSPRVTFGNQWLKQSVMEIYREDVARFKVLLKTEPEDDVFEQIKKGKTPKLRALNIHNSTVYRWNRPCYGISPNGKPHLRIENRILPAGPSVPDAMANAAFWLGLMNGMEEEYPDISRVMGFDHAKANFFAAARYGMDTRLHWVNQQKISPRELIKKELLPIARVGLSKAGIDQQDIDQYLNIIEARNENGQTGACWVLDSFSKLHKEGLTRDEISTAITASMYEHQFEGKPVHEWELACDEMLEYEPSTLLVEEFMSTDLITVQEDDILDLAANLMNWRRIRHVPVEDKQGKLVGLITNRILLRYFTEHRIAGVGNPPILVKDIMIKDPITVTPEENITQVMGIMEQHKVGCLPVLKKDKLVGIITEADFLTISANLVKRLARRREQQQPGK